MLPLEPKNWRVHTVLACALHDSGQPRAAAAHMRVAFSCRLMLGETVLRARRRPLRPGTDVVCTDRSFVGPRGTITVTRSDGSRVCLDPGADLPGEAASNDLDLVLASLAAIRFVKATLRAAEPRQANIGCDQCDTRLAADEKTVICALCGADLEPMILEPCGWCGSNTIWFLAPVLHGRGCECPYCHLGNLRPL
jgi:hypothetical protein